jgi:translocator protein
MPLTPATHAERANNGSRFLRYALLTVPLIVVLGYLSGRVSNSGYGNPWFDRIVKPAIMPPGWVFGAAWTVLYILLGLVLAMLLAQRSARDWGLIVGLFVLQMLLNFSWSPVFFGLQQITAGLVIIIAMLIISVIVTMLLWRVRVVAAALMLPYLGWLTFAAILNYQILVLNRT